MTGRRWFLSIAAIGIGFAGFFLVRAASGDAVYYLYPNEAMERRADFVDGRVFQLAGTVVPGTIRQSGQMTTFSVTDDIVTIPVELSASTPLLFQEGVEVLIEGSFDGDVFVSDNQPILRHSADYEAPEEGNAPPAAAGG
jgi:cytochrome c-type biogenesis protein CcmE